MRLGYSGDDSSTRPLLREGIPEIASILGTQALFAFLRRSNPDVLAVMENEPILLMKDGVLIRDNLAKARVSEEDVAAKLREANVLELKNVRAVVLETTGDISVLHGDVLEGELLLGVKPRN